MGLVLDDLRDSIHHAVQVDVIVLYHCFRGLDPGDVEDIVDEAQQ